ncbi:hypothetical protein Cs7R123_38450 [Catellatospora sp. TT07R-123]|uniref:hypothetical protein n=1 Tax=Catellatospora sp. TT07R-123 TaxID=2733863 RepID=UPI001B0C3C35|nr:hypothetical protein [Catellatospora sp. TT07R-123]GHJ46503.1 hypothetical protein Cs7R123_38450 [Catellatospora sp. TT07R-123]
MPRAARRSTYLGVATAAFAAWAALGATPALATEPSPSTSPSSDATKPTPSASPTPAQCPGNLTLTQFGGGGAVPTAKLPEQPIVEVAALTNDSGAILTDGWIFFQVTPSTDVYPPTLGPTSPVKPSVSWSVDGGAWHAVPLRWFYVEPSQGLSFWTTDEMPLHMVLAPHVRHSFRFRMTFHRGSPVGSYTMTPEFGASCTPFVSGHQRYHYDSSQQQNTMSTQTSASPVGGPSASPSAAQASTGASPTRMPDPSPAAADASKGQPGGPWLAGGAAVMTLLAGFVAVKAARTRRLLS